MSEYRRSAEEDVESDGRQAQTLAKGPYSRGPRRPKITTTPDLTRLFEGINLPLEGALVSGGGNPDDPDDPDDTPGDDGEDDDEDERDELTDADSARFAYDEASRIIDHQHRFYNNESTRLLQIGSFGLVLIGVVGVGAQIRGGLDILMGVIGWGVGLLFTSFLIVLYTVYDSQIAFGPSVDELEEAMEHDTRAKRIHEVRFYIEDQIIQNSEMQSRMRTLLLVALLLAGVGIAVAIYGFVEILN